MQGTCNKCIFPLNKNASGGMCPTDTSLVYAAAKGKLSCVKELIAAGGDVNAVCECHGNGALIAGTCSGNAFCLIELIRAGADVNHRNNTGSTALMFASDNGCLEELIEAGADVNVKDDCQHAPLMYAAQRGNTNIVKMLIDAGADVNAPCECHGNGALIAATMNGFIDCLKELIRASANVNYQNMNGSTALMFVSNKECLKELISSGADVNICTNYQYTALIYAGGERKRGYCEGNYFRRSRCKFPYYGRIHSIDIC